MDRQPKFAAIGDSHEKLQIHPMFGGVDRHFVVHGPSENRDDFNYEDGHNFNNENRYHLNNNCWNHIHHTWWNNLYHQQASSQCQELPH